MQKQSFNIKDNPVANELVNTGLPVVVIDTENSAPIEDKVNWISATMTIYGNDTYPGSETAEIQIRGRGNSTWDWSKKPYNIKLGKKAEVLGMPKHKRWCLLANYADYSLLRNNITFELGRKTSLQWTPSSVHAELVLNGEHVGNYLVTEHIKVDKNRLNITEMEPEDIEGEAVTGGYLLELDARMDEENVWLSPISRVPYAIQYPDSDDIVQPQVDWIKNHITEVEEVIYGDNFADPETGYPSLIDPVSFVDYWIIFELGGNYEIKTPLSAFMYKDRNGKIFSGPVWDFDLFTYSKYSHPAYADKLDLMDTVWYGKLFNDPQFRALAKTRWNELRDDLMTITIYIEEMGTYLRESQRINEEIWPKYGCSNEINGGELNIPLNGDEEGSYEDAILLLKQNIIERISVMSRLIDEL